MKRSVVHHTAKVMLLVGFLAWTAGCKPPTPPAVDGKDSTSNATDASAADSNTTVVVVEEAVEEAVVEPAPAKPEAPPENSVPANDIGPPAADDSAAAESTASNSAAETPADQTATQPAEVAEKAPAENPANNTAPASDAVALAEEPAQAPAEKKLAADPRDWPNWRGPEYNGISRETGLVNDWDPNGGEGSNLLWKRDDLGTRSTPIVMRGKLYVLCRHEPHSVNEKEKVVCVDAATGETIWENLFGLYLTDVPDTRVAWSSVVGDPETGNIYALGVGGLFKCIDGETGKTLWSHSMHEEFGLLSTYGGRTNLPVVCDDLVIISAVIIGWGDMARPAHRFLAFDKRTGEVVWFNGTTPLPEDTTYSAPAIATVNGEKQLVFGSGDGFVWGFQPRTGVPLWHFKFSRRGLNISPVVVGDTVYMGHSEEIFDPTSNLMGSVAAFKATGKGEVTGDKVLWQKDEVMCGKSSPLVIDDRLYFYDDGGNLNVFDVKTGEEIEIDRKLFRQIKMRNMRGSPLYADGKIYVVSEAGQWFIAKPDKEKVLEVIASSGRDKTLDETNASPIASHGRVYITTSGAIYCLEDKAQQHGYEPGPAPAQETPVAEDEQPAHLQIVPAEALIKPGEKLQFKARLFNAKGQFLKESPAEYSVQGPAQINSDGQLSSDAAAAHKAAIVTGGVGDLKGTARVRIVPALPWSFDFDEIAIDQKTPTGAPYGEPPVTWVGVRYRNIIRDVDGKKVLVKVTTIPKGTRSQGWMGPADLSDYTVQADVMGAETEGQMPDIGLIAQGYRLDLQGNHQKLVANDWPPQERISMVEANRNDDGSDKSRVPFKWEPGKWYTMKFRVSNEGSVARLQGKVWPRGEEEPKEWTVDAQDPAPHRQGSPGLFGDAKSAEVYFDNITVTDNKASS